MTIKRRFIAGAKCPKCQAMDRVVMLTADEAEWIECIECDYTENRPTILMNLKSQRFQMKWVIQFKPRQSK